MNWRYLLNTAWMVACQREAYAFHLATRRVAQTQEAVLQEILHNNRNTRYGASRRFSAQLSPLSFQQTAPLTTYADYEEAISRIADGERNILTTEPVQLFEPTSGTTNGEKWIPYTASLRRQYQRAVSAWIADLWRRRPDVRRGAAYWSISPALGAGRTTSGGVPIGFDDDTAYLSRAEQWAVRRLLVAPPEISRLTNLENFRYAALLFLLAAQDLSLISIWSPTFLTAILQPLLSDSHVWLLQICDDIRCGKLALPHPSAEANIPSTLSSRSPNARRSAELEKIFHRRKSVQELFASLWPRLALISCWTDAAAAHYAKRLRNLFPHVEIQSKGLMATEGVISFPLVDREGAALAIRSHFFEFAEADSLFPLTGSQILRRADQLEKGGVYRVVLTTGGGLYRYQLGDRIQVVGFENRCPLLRFVGRDDRVSDLVGEKLSEAHVQQSLQQAFEQHNVTPQFALVAPVHGALPHYCLYFQDQHAVKEALLEQITAAVEEGLKANPYYRHAVAMGQLAPLQIHQLDTGGEPCMAIYERACLERGQKLGNVKPPALDSEGVKFAEHSVVGK